jgi:hypothetical protein
MRSTGFSSVAGTIRRLTVEDVLQQIINTGSPQVIAGINGNKPIDRGKARIVLDTFRSDYRHVLLNRVAR